VRGGKSRGNGRRGVGMWRIRVRRGEGGGGGRSERERAGEEGRGGGMGVGFRRRWRGVRQREWMGTREYGEWEGGDGSKGGGSGVVLSVRRLGEEGWGEGGGKWGRGGEHREEGEGEGNKRGKGE